ncbi:MAG: tyrosine decarboxylase MfnA [Candidatus Hodarchaeota archaeon]
MITEESSIKDSLDINEQLMKDFNYSTGQILSSMNSSPEKKAREIFIDNLEKNLGDPALFPGTAEIETQVVNILGNLFQLPSTGTGVILSGGSEANITALWAIRNKKTKEEKWKDKGKLEIIAPESVHISIDKAADLLGLKLVKVPVISQYRIDLQEVKKSINKKTIAIVGVAGTTALGTIDPLRALNEICLAHDLDLHIDAAFGGLVFPFLENSYEFNLSFNLEAVSSITVDIHKMGRVPIPGGGLLWRNSSYPESIKFTLPYLAGSPQQTTLTGTRSGAATIAFASLWNELGFEGFKRIVDTCISDTKYLEEELRSRAFQFPINPVINILGILPPKNIDICSLNKKLWALGWTTTIVNGLLRVVIMPPTTRKDLERFLKLIDKIMR